MKMLIASVYIVAKLAHKVDMSTYLAKFDVMINSPIIYLKLIFFGLNSVEYLANASADLKIISAFFLIVVFPHRGNLIFCK